MLVETCGRLGKTHTFWEASFKMSTSQGPLLGSWRLGEEDRALRLSWGKRTKEGNKSRCGGGDTAQQFPEKSRAVKGVKRPL